jgi:hypothetical protein
MEQEVGKILAMLNLSIYKFQIINSSQNYSMGINWAEHDGIKNKGIWQKISIYSGNARK